MAALVEAREESASEVTRKGWTKRKAASADGPVLAGFAPPQSVVAGNRYDGDPC